MTFREILYDIKEQYKLMSDDSWPPLEWIAFIVNNARGAVMQQRYSDPRNIVPYNEYQTVTLAVGSNAITTNALPAIIKTTGNASSPIKVSTDGALNIPINVVSLDRLPYVGYNPFLTDMIYCSMSNDGKIVFNSQNSLYKLIDSISVRAIFEDPESAYDMEYPNGTDFWDTEYPVSNGVLLDIRKIVDAKMEGFLNTKKDTLNDGTDENLIQNPQGDK
jgi:hypothetical protein